MTRRIAVRARSGRIRTGLSITCCCALLQLASATTAAAGEVPCLPLPNGSFDEFLAGWLLVPESSQSGDAFINDMTGIVDASGYQLPDGSFFDDRVLFLSMEAVAGLNGEIGHASHTLTAEAQVVANGRYLHLRRGGAFEFQFLGTGGRAISAVIRVESLEGDVAERVIYDFGNTPEPGCFFGLSVLGTFDSLLPDLYIDVAEAGIEAGEMVTVSAALRVHAETVDPCQFNITSASLLVDEFEFCATRPHPADIDRDGDVDEVDYGLFVSVLLGENFDALHGITSDVNEDGFADGADVGPFVAAVLGEE